MLSTDPASWTPQNARAANSLPGHFLTADIGEAMADWARLTGFASA